MCICWMHKSSSLVPRQTKPAVDHKRVSILCSFNLCLCFRAPLPALLSVIFTFQREEKASRKPFVSEIKWQKHVFIWNHQEFKEGARLGVFLFEIELMSFGLWRLCPSNWRS